MNTRRCGDCGAVLDLGSGDILCGFCETFARRKPQASSPKPQVGCVLDAPTQSSSATDGGAPEQGCSPAEPRTVAPPAAVCGVSDFRPSIAPATATRSMTRAMNRCNCGAVMQPSISRVVKLCRDCDTYALIPVADGDDAAPSKPARLDFDHCAMAAIDAITNLHACINQNRSRLTVAQVATVKDHLRLIEHTICLWGLGGSARPNDLPGSRPQAASARPQARTATALKGWGSR